MYWILAVILSLVAIHYLLPELAVRLAQQAMRWLYDIKMWLVMRRRRQLQKVLAQIEEDKLMIAEEETVYKQLLVDLDAEDAEVQRYVSQYIDIER